MLTLPAAVEAVLRNFWTCELTTMSKNGAPVTWPVIVHYQPEKDRFVMATSIGFAQKAINIRRDARVSLLFSEPTGSELVRPPAVLVQGRARADDEIVTSADADGLLAYIHGLEQRPHRLKQSVGNNPVLRWFMDFYFMRLMVYVYPQRVSWWPDADFAQPPQVIEVSHVG